MNMKHAFSIDLEDWYQGIELPREAWKNKEHRLEKGLDVVLELLESSHTRATFFCLGWIGENFRSVIKRISDAGHEIASHGYSHEKIYTLSPDTFREDIRRTKGILEDISGSSVIGNRSPYFSVTRDSLWALPILREEGYRYDSSISPIVTWRYGISNSPRQLYKITDVDLIEYPVSTTTLFGKRIGVGGAYFRIFPYFIFKRAFQSAVTPQMFYAHPWEFDPKHPSITFDWRARLTHYFNLPSMLPKTKALLSAFSFCSVWDAITHSEKSGGVAEITMKVLRGE